MVKRFTYVSIGVLCLVLLGCGEPHDPGIAEGSNQLGHMKPRAFIATTAMHALLETQPELKDEELARRAFEIADAMITEGERPRSTGEE